MNTTSSTNKQANLWYKNYMVLIFVIGLPVFVVLICLFFIFYSIKIQDSTVRDDWYMDGKTLYQDASRDKLSHDLGIWGIMRFDGLDNGDSKVSFELNYPKDSLNSGQLSDGTALDYPKTLAVHISHATDDNKDRDFVITYQQGNQYTGTVALDATPAKYYLQISNSGTHNWRLIQKENLPIHNIVFTPLTSFDDEQSQLPNQKDKRLSSHPSSPSDK
ncbi:FixH family protein [Moraxella sp. ZJ142]|uniref:FixH family protein n=1 Tax=Moraxella marmotae TaxID=3344520 RepID=UPI0035D4F3B5